LRLQLTMRRLWLVVALLLVAAPGRSEDRVTVRGAYYREHSTRVVQPMVEAFKDLPYGIDVGAHFLVDAITSASVAAGTASDSIFTEMRKEAGFTIGETILHTRIAGGYRQSREPDYVSHTGSLSFLQDVWENSGTLAVVGAFSYDTIGPMLDRHLDTWFGGVGYTQALLPTLNTQLAYDVTYLDGYQANPYIQVPNLGREKIPAKRLRHALAARIAYYIPMSSTGLQLHYRYYFDHGVGKDKNFLDEMGVGRDPWQLRANTIEGHLFQTLGPNVDVRLTFRHHSQGAAAFWCNTDPTRGGVTDCYGTMPTYYSADAKLGPLATNVVEAELNIDARPLQTVPVLQWFSGGSFQLSYGRYLQDTRYGDAHLLQTGYTLAF
jgi:hypothetical protein